MAEAPITDVYVDPAMKKGVGILDDIKGPSAMSASTSGPHPGKHQMTRAGSRRSFDMKCPAPVRPTWERYFPGGYTRESQLPWTGNKLLKACEVFAGLAILFYGYDQGVMSGVNNSPDYKRLMGINSDPQTSRDAAATGGIVAIYYLGTLIGGMIAGSLGDRIGRLKTIWLGCFIATIGAAFQSAAMNITWMCCARIVTGLGTGALNCIVPVWTAELSPAGGRGAALGFEFFLNIVGLALAYWIEYALRGGNQVLRWRLPLAIQIAFLLVLLVAVSYFPESPRWLARMGDETEARHILARLRTVDVDEDDEDVNAEYYAISEVVELERRSAGANHYGAMVFKKDRFNIRRRVGLVVWLQIMQELVGIAVVTVYAPTVFQQAGYSADKADLLSGINDLSYAASVWVAVLTLDRVGRRVTLYWGAVVMGFSLILAGIGARYASDTALSDAVRLSWGGVVTTFVFVYTATFGASWLVVPWLYPTEIMPLHVRAKGGAWSVFGWSIGNGAITVITPFLFNAIGYWTFILFAMLNFLTLPFIYFLYPESSGRSLESMDILFAGSIVVQKAERERDELEKEDPESFAAALRGDVEIIGARRRANKSSKGLLG